MALPWKIEPLSAAHDRAGFSCGQPSLDEFLKRLAGQYERKDFARTYVAIAPPDAAVQGYYTLSGGSLDLSVLPDAVRKKLPRHPVPVARLGRLAVTRSKQGSGLGKLLLLDALRRCAVSSVEVALYAMEVDATDDAVKAFYLHFGFEPLADDPQHLYLSVKSLRSLRLG